MQGNKKCLCKKVPNIIARLEALEAKYLQNGCSAGQCCQKDNEKELLMKSQYLDKVEQSISLQEIDNQKKKQELIEASNDIHKLIETMNAMQKSQHGTETVETLKQEIQGYVDYWSSINMMFMQIYEQFKGLLKLEDLPKDNLSIIYGIKNMGEGLFKFGQLLENLPGFDDGEIPEDGEEKEEQ